MIYHSYTNQQIMYLYNIYIYNKENYTIHLLLLCFISNYFHKFTMFILLNSITI